MGEAEQKRLEVEDKEEIKHWILNRELEAAQKRTEEEQKISHDEEVDKKENMEPALESKEEDEENLSQEDEMALRELINLIAEEKIKPDEAAEKKENIDTAPEMKTRALEDITPDAA